ncbi:allergin-1 isoform X2 [Pelobates cultripes]|uniref:Allergin-1 isoform X2 n=1 Tax=Pelobates cultripes TaxID=61616 RepID=A0AAD1S808_PELCU|nr:allergin-1 isoform X2 [Pelobates cultripes]
MLLRYHLLFYVSVWESVKSEGEKTKNITSLKLIPRSNVTMIGNTETISCLSTGGSVPITYQLFHNRSINGRIISTEQRQISFNVTIIDTTYLGTYRCKANNTSAIYSQSFYFTLQENESNGSPAPSTLILVLLLVFILVPALVLSAFVFRRICRRRSNDRIYANTTTEVTGDRIYENMLTKEAETVGGQEINYSTIVRANTTEKNTNIEYTAIRRHQ